MALILFLMGWLVSGCTFIATITDLNSKSITNSESDPTNGKPVAEATSLTPINASNYTSYGLSGSCSYVDSVTIKTDTNTSLGTATCSAGASGANGTWNSTINFSSLSDGNINLQLYDSSSGSLLKSYTVLKDIILPTLGGVVSDGIYYSSFSSSPILTWSTGSDTGGSGIQKYQIAIGSGSGGTQILNWTDIGNVTSYQITGLSLSEGTSYYPSVRVVDFAGNPSAIINGDGWIADAAGPLAPAAVYDGEQIPSTSYSSWIAWTAATSTGASVATYEVRIVDSSNTQVVAWTLVGNVLGYGFTGLTLTEGQTYRAEVRAIDVAGNTGATTQGDGWYVVPQGWKQQAYVKPPNMDTDDLFGSSVAIYGDTAVVGAYGEGSNQTTITNGSTASSNNALFSVGAVYVFKRTGTTWSQEAYIKAPNAGADDHFGYSVAIFEDTIVAGADNEGSNQTTITNGTTASSNNSALASGAAYVFKRTGTTWAQEAYIKPSNTEAGDSFGTSVAVFENTIVVGAHREDSNQTTITNGATASADNSNADSGAAYVFKRTGTTWAQEAYLKPSNNDIGDRFGISVAIFEDTIAIGSNGEDSNQTTITNGATASADNSLTNSGAIYVFKRAGVTWTQEAYVKAPNVNIGDNFGFSVSIYNDTLVAGATAEDSNQITITNGTTASSDNSVNGAGAAYVFKRTGTSWAQQAYLKPPNTDVGDNFGYSVSVFGDSIIVGAPFEASNQTTITNGTTASSNNSVTGSGAVYVFKRTGTTWAQEAYVKAPNSGSGSYFGYRVNAYNDTFIVGAPLEPSNQTTITNGATASNNTSLSNAGAAYIFTVDRVANWSQQAYVKAPNAEASDAFGSVVAISEDTVVVSATAEASNQVTITNGTTASANNSAADAGAVYVFKRTGVNWAQQAYIKPPNMEAGDSFGISIAISGDTIAVGASAEDSNQTTITNGTTASANNSANRSGAVYVFKRTGTTWAQQAYIKAPNAEADDLFGVSVAISGDTLVVGAVGEDSNQTTITNGTTASVDNSLSGSGAAYVFKRNGTTWAQEAYLKAPNVNTGDNFGYSVSIFGDTIVVGAQSEASNQTSITNGTTASADNSLVGSGAAYVFKRTGNAWAQEAYLKASNANVNDLFGKDVTISGDTIAVNAEYEDANQTWITNGTTASSNNSISTAGAVYVFKRTGSTWAQEAYLKPPNVGSNNYFGTSVAISGDLIVVGALGEASNQTTITNGTTASSNNSSPFTGAAYVFKRTGTTWAQESYIKAVNAEGDAFGWSVDISGNTVVVGAPSEASDQTTITNGSTASSSNLAPDSGAAYIYAR